MEVLKAKKDKHSKKMKFTVLLSEEEYIQTCNFLQKNKDGLMYVGDGKWAPTKDIEPPFVPGAPIMDEPEIKTEADSEVSESETAILNEDK